MTEFEFYKLMDKQSKLLVAALRKANELKVKDNLINQHKINFELIYINLIESYLLNSEIKFPSVKEYLFWIGKQIQSVNRKIKADPENYNLGQQSLVYFVYLYNELEKIYFGNDLAYKVAIANIELMILNISEMN